MQVKLWVGVVILLVFLASSKIALAVEVNHFICHSADRTDIEWSKEIKLSTFDSKGLIVGQIEKSSFHVMNSRCNGTFRIQSGLKPDLMVSNGYCKYRDKDGDAVYLEWSRTQDRSQQPWSFIHGTGKWKGITGGGDWNTRKSGIRSKPQVEEGFQNCVHVTGTYELPK